MFLCREGCAVVSVFAALYGKNSGESGRRFLTGSLDGVFASGSLRGSFNGARAKSLDGVLRRSLKGVCDLRVLRYFRLVSLSSERSFLGGESCRFSGFASTSISMFACLLTL